MSELIPIPNGYADLLEEIVCRIARSQTPRGSGRLPRTRPALLVDRSRDPRPAESRGLGLKGHRSAGPRSSGALPGCRGLQSAQPPVYARAGGRLA